MARRYLRRARVEIGVGGSILTVSDLRLTFEIQRSLSKNRMASVSIWNLAPRTAERVRERRERLRLMAGFDRTLHVVWAGDISRVEHERRENDRITTIESPGLIDRPTVDLSVEGPIPLRDVVQRLGSSGGLALGPLDAVPAETLDGVSWSGSVTDALTHFLGPRGVQWHEVNGEILFSVSGTTVSTGGQRLVSEATGMVGTPTLTDDGAEAVVLLDPTFELDARVDLKSAAVDGQFRVAALEHRGDTWASGVWQTSLDLRPL